jgi:hypothetical protein
VTFNNTFLHRSLHTNQFHIFPFKPGLRLIPKSPANQLSALGTIVLYRVFLNSAHIVVHFQTSAAVQRLQHERTCAQVSLDTLLTRGAFQHFCLRKSTSHEDMGYSIHGTRCDNSWLEEYPGCLQPACMRQAT